MSWITLAFAGEWTALHSSDDPYTVQVLESDGNFTILHYVVNGYGSEEITINDQKYTLLQKPRKESMIEEAGYPRLPRINRSIVIPDDGVMGWDIISADYIEVTDIDIAPSKGNFSRKIDPSSVPYTFADVYEEDAFFPADLVHLRDPYIMRDIRGAVVELNAFQYNPVTRTLRIYTDVTVEITKKSGGGENVLVRRGIPEKIDSQFLKLYQRHFINLDDLDYPHLAEPGGMLVICYDDFMDAMEPFVEWKNLRGIPTEIVPVSAAGSSTTAIKNYIRNYFNQNDLTFVLLVGDAAQVPAFAVGSDPLYSLLVGSDSYPEIFVGRFSAENRAHVLTQVERTINYEKYPDPALSWYHMGLGDADESGPTNDEQYDFQHITNIANKLVHWNYTQVDSVYTTFGGTTQMIADFLNDGRSILNYAGHGWYAGMGPVYFDNDDVNDLVNDNMLPHIVTIACDVGSFINHTCFGETWQRATNGVTGAPTGGIANYMSKISQTWFPPYDMQDEGIDLLVSDSVVTFGGMCFNGSGLMIDIHGSGGEYEFENWTIFGDPSVYLRSMAPYDLTVTHDVTLPVGSSSLNVQVNGPGGPLNEAMVCAMNNNTYAHGFTDASGYILLNFDPPLLTPGTLTLTVTRSNPIPYIGDVEIIPVSGPYVIYESHAIRDDITGNNNNQLDYSESVELDIEVANVGITNALNVTGNISSSDSLITYSTNSAAFGTVNAGSTVTVERAFTLELAANAPDGYTIPFTLSTTDGFNSWESSFTITAHAPEVVFSSLVIDDVAGGNGNGALDPGETADLHVTMTNDGSSDVDDVIAMLTTIDPFVTVNTYNSQYGAMLAGASASGTFNVSIASTCPQDHLVEFDMEVSGALNYSNNTGFSTIVGNIQYVPSGPDNYGYLAYDVNDAPELPVFDWVEISAYVGGPGTLVPIVNDEQVIHYELPFTFKYYGVEYDSFTVAANGWIGMGIVPEDDYSNSGIPNDDGPAPMIAPYWEDLSPQLSTSGGVWQWYDEVNHLLIVEYSMVEQYAPSGSIETFEVILYDPIHFPTMTGDGQIKFQYGNMSEASASEGTIGIENHAENDGIQYFFDSDYDVHASPIDSGMAILFTTTTTTPEMSIELTYVSGSPVPANGGNVYFDVYAENYGTVALNFDAWIEISYDGGSPVTVVQRTFANYLPGWFIERSGTWFPVPGGYAAGYYTLTGKVGNHPDIAWDESGFPFIKDGNTGIGDFTPWIPNDIPDPFDPGDGQNPTSLIPSEYALHGAYPNPFNPSTALSYQLPARSFVELTVYDIQGRLIAELVNDWRNAGVHEVTFDASTLTSGIYIYRLTADSYNASSKMVLMK